jgi:hypothetical protein
MCCDPKEAKTIKAEVDCSSGCCCGSFRRFATKKEQLECLEKYKEQLQNELTGVNEKIKDLSGK